MTTIIAIVISFLNDLGIYFEQLDDRLIHTGCNGGTP